MSDKKEMYVGNAKAISNGGLKIQLDLTQLGEYLKGEAKDKQRKWTDKTGKEHKTIDLVVFPLKSENVTEHRTHSVKVDSFVPDPNYNKPQGKNPAQPVKVDDPFANLDDSLPF